MRAIERVVMEFEATQAPTVCAFIDELSGSVFEALLELERREFSAVLDCLAEIEGDLRIERGAAGLPEAIRLGARADVVTAVNTRFILLLASRRPHGVFHGRPRLCVVH